MSKFMFQVDCDRCGCLGCSEGNCCDHEPQVKKFLYEIDVRMVKRVVVTAKSKEDALEIVKTAIVVLQVDDERDKVVLLGDSPAGDETRTADLLAEDGTPEWKYYFGGLN